MSHEIILSGFGGQGVLLMGQLLAQAGLEEGRKVSWIPAYGPEMRGGTAYCSVVISDKPIGSPLVRKPTLVVAMNLPSMLRFEPALRPGGVLVLNSTIIPEEPKRGDITIHKVPMNDMAAELGHAKGLNIIGLGAVAGIGGIVTREAALKAMDVMFGKKFADKPGVLELNLKAFEAGYAAVTAGK